MICILQSAHAENIEFPANAGVINIKDAPYNAAGDGQTDDSDAIIQAIKDNIGEYDTRTIYFPNGTYLVSKQLPWQTADGDWHCYLSFQGQSRDGTTIKLKDNATGFNSTENYKAVIYTASQVYSTSDDPENIGEGNEAYANFIHNITVDVGENPGAVGIDFLGNNYAGIYDTKIIGNGYIGLSMQRYGAGPLLVKDLEIDGFQYGIKTAQQDYGITFENIYVKNQEIAGIANSQNILSIYNLTSHNQVPAIQNTDEIGHITLIKAALVNGQNTKAAIENVGNGLYLRDVATSGYTAAIQQNGVIQSGTMIAEYAPEYTNSESNKQNALALTIKTTPVLPNDPVEDWANVTDFGADLESPYDNKTEAIQNAIDSGASTVFLPRGFYLIDSPIIVRGNVRRIISPGCRFDLTWDNSFDDASSPKGIFHIADGTHDTVEISKIYYWGAFNGAPELPASYYVFAKHASSRTLILRDIQFNGFLNEPDCGELFLEDICINDIHFNHEQSVWARQFNTEGSESDYKCINNGGNLWILGLKTELASTIIKTSNGGQTEILGGLIYPVESPDNTMAAFINEDSRLSLIYSTTAYDAEDDYSIQVKEIFGSAISTLNKDDIPQRGYGRQVTLYNSFEAQLTAPVMPTLLKVRYNP